MTIWKAHLIRENLVKKSKEMGLRLPQMQMLLAQERFLTRLFSIEESRFFVLEMLLPRLLKIFLS